MPDSSTDDEQFTPLTHDEALNDLDKPIRNRLLLIKCFEFEVPCSIEECLAKLESPIPVKYNFGSAHLRAFVAPLQDYGYGFSAIGVYLKTESYLPMEMSGLLESSGKHSVLLRGRASSGFSTLMVVVAWIMVLILSPILSRPINSLMGIFLLCNGSIFVIVGLLGPIMILINRNNMIKALKAHLSASKV